MTKYILDVLHIPPFSNESPKQAIVLFHGYGGDGKDISILANNWRRFLPHSVFLCPNGPEICKVNPNGFEWFDLSSENSNTILENSLIAEEKLNIFLDQILDNFNLENKNLALVGFSQGCMISIQLALKKRDQINCLIGYSGKIINENHLSNTIISKPKIFLMHGDKDAIVPPSYFLDAKDFFKKKKIKIKTKLFKDCEHRIPVEGISLGLEFLKINLL